MIDWTSWILQKNFEAKQEERLTKAYINNPSVPKGSCNCGAHKTGSHMHSDWCGGLKPQKFKPNDKGFTFEHTDTQDWLTSNAPHKGHSFNVYHDGKYVGKMKSVQFHKDGVPGVHIVDGDTSLHLPGKSDVNAADLTPEEMKNLEKLTWDAQGELDDYLNNSGTFEGGLTKSNPPQYEKPDCT